MKLIQQSPLLREKFAQKIQAKQQEKHQSIYQKLGENPLGHLVVGMAQVESWRNNFKGRIGEDLTAWLVSFFPRDWLMGRNIFIPTRQGNLTEIDLVLIGTKGVFLLEIKAWKGSFSAYKDVWKRRQGTQWLPIQNSPTKQSLYHKKTFEYWILKQGFNQLPFNYLEAPVVFIMSKWVGAKQCSVPIITARGDLINFIQSRSDCLSMTQALKIAEAIAHVQETDLKGIEENIQHTVKKVVPKPKQKPKITIKETVAQKPTLKKKLSNQPKPKPKPQRKSI